MSHILRLAYLSPTVVEAILDGKYPAHLTMKDLFALAHLWDGENLLFGYSFSNAWR